MKVKVREGYIVTLYTEAEISQGQKKVKRVNEQQFFEGDEVDMSPEQLKLQAARVEPMDEGAAKFLADLVLVPASPTAAPDFKAAVAAEVAKALADAGVKVKVAA